MAGFAGRHGEPICSQDRDTVVLTAPDGSVARLRGWADAQVTRDVTTPARLAAWARPPESVGLVLVRRGGYAVGLARDSTLDAHKCGTRYVQSRTAAGGWSQQRFARRRGNQADALVGTVAEHALRLVAGARPHALVVGGDKALVRAVLDEPRLAPLAHTCRRELFDLPDPRFAVLKQALRRGRAVRISLPAGH